MIIVFVLNMKIPSTQVGICHVMASQFSRLDVPNQVAVLILIPDLDSASGDPINSLQSITMMKKMFLKGWPWPMMRLRKVELEVHLFDPSTRKPPAEKLHNLSG